MPKKRVLITGQDGSDLAEFLLEKGDQDRESPRRGETFVIRKITSGLRTNWAASGSPRIKRVCEINAADL